MNHRPGFNRLRRRAAHRKALLKNMATSLINYERIKTTRAKAKALKTVIEKMITRAKVDSVHNRRIIAKDITNKAIVAKLFTEIGPRYKERAGGYTRIIRIGQRISDASDMVFLEMLDRKIIERVKKEKKAKTSVSAT